MRKRSEVLLEFVRRPAGGNEMDFVEIETAVGGSRNRKMAVVYGIERAAKERDTARMMFSGGAVRLRGGQWVSESLLREAAAFALCSSIPPRTISVKATPINNKKAALTRPVRESYDKATAR